MVRLPALKSQALTAILTPREAWTVGAVDACLKDHAEFQAAYPGATLVRVESNRGVAENRQGRYYLRYQYDHGATEFWGYLSSKSKFDFRKGTVGLVATSEAPTR